MRKVLIALAVAVGIGAIGSAAVAAPASTPSTGTSLDVQGLFTPAQYYGGYGYRYRPRCYYVRRCSGYYPYQRCWRERICH
ncbi:hypothetical protein [Pseudorhodoplanes sinuspersici]|nr:hypothetical protein [Pseudorhodoplanes sinuspersici]RKE73245.1 hypothetical protein DFP91_1125 [Pseudorhodoplanes sinuspersici]